MPLSLAGALFFAGAVPIALLSSRNLAPPAVHASEQAPADLSIDYPLNGSIFPPEITPPTFIWHDASPASSQWRVRVTFTDGSAPLEFESRGEKPTIGDIDQRCISSTNELPRLRPDQDSAHTWSPDAKSWELIKKHSFAGAANVTISGYAQADATRPLSTGATTLSTSKDPVGAPIFYRDVPLMPSETEKGIIKPLANDAVHKRRRNQAFVPAPALV